MARATPAGGNDGVASRHFLPRIQHMQISGMRSGAIVVRSRVRLSIPRQTPATPRGPAFFEAGSPFVGDPRRRRRRLKRLRQLAVLVPGQASSAPVPQGSEPGLTAEPLCRHSRACPTAVRFKLAAESALPSSWGLSPGSRNVSRKQAPADPRDKPEDDGVNEPGEGRNDAADGSAHAVRRPVNPSSKPWPVPTPSDV